MTDPTKEAGFLMFKYPIADAEAIEQRIGTVDYPPGPEANKRGSGVGAPALIREPNDVLPASFHCNDVGKSRRILVRPQRADDLHKVVVRADAPVEPDVRGDVQPPPLDGL